ncbi:hypothetical protein ASPZODRAFT_28178 [Penicilliopsis zonata CBS 506.65]|uniref:DUF6603 domain-containing protein n=1 Tax=Penicilliopsis zonata CBS 506.65 TaxID=1073090 RepID=A0A1L9S8L5_9EURO|nr:hypothetical protein ASPZODRAFT_28178 [Penicilliopsis zonata CBS 506.65]OJJ43500.1 hypothetical protein ASPZODRAFT_28178 [Penicilliopsis zonata CBS 506.65]
MLLPADGSDHALIKFMSTISIPSISISYGYQGKKPSHLEMKGTICLGPLELSLDYSHNGQGWNLSGQLHAGAALAAKQVKLGDLLKDLVGEHLDSFPEFLLNATLSPADIQVSWKAVRKTMKSSAVREPAEDYMVFCLVVTVKAFSFCFLQLQDEKGVYPTPTTGGTKPRTQTPVRRLFRFSWNELPEMPQGSIPIVKELPRPFDKLSFLWVSADLTCAQVQFLNSVAFTESPGDTSPLVWKASKKKSQTPVEQEKEIALVAGCHFQAILAEQGRPNCLLDYVFYGGKKTAESTANTAGDDQEQPGQDQPGATASAPLARASRGLTLRNIGLRMEHGKVLTISLDATASLGPVACDLVGFAVKLDFSQFSFDKAGTGGGLGVDFALNGLSLAGMVVRETLKGQAGGRYLGGLALGAGAWTFLAAGMLEQGPEYNSVFAFARLQGPLITFSFIEVNGLVGGFGYNSRLRLPQPEQVAQFPFVSINTGGGSAEGIVNQFHQLVGGPDANDGAWIKSQRDSLWLAAGLGVKAFQALNVQAVLAVDLPEHPRFGVFAQAVAALPKGSFEEKSFLFFDFVLGGTLDPEQGLLAVTGFLTPRSFLLDRSCRVTGGFALAVFTAPSPHAGDWVFSVGGFHPRFQRPGHYPPPPPRVGISWAYDSHLRISGEAYFAITPRACMAGARLDAVFETDVPFHFEAEVGISISFAARLDCFFFTINVSGSVSAVVELYGPPVAGVAHVHLLVLDISVRFGQRQYSRPPLAWAEFAALVKQAPSPAEARHIPDHLLVVTRGLLADSEDKSTANPDLWRVRGPQFEFQVQSRFPLREVVCNGTSSPSVNQQGRQFFAAPMQLQSHEPFEVSRLEVTITTHSSNLGSDAGLSFLMTPIVNAVPKALWGEYNPNSEQDPYAVLNDQATTNHPMGVSLCPGKPADSEENLPPIFMNKFRTINVSGSHSSTVKTGEFSVPLRSLAATESHSAFSSTATSPGKDETQAAIFRTWEIFMKTHTGGGVGF